VPAGSSTGSYEAKELRDGGERYRGGGVKTAIENIESIIAPKLTGMSVRDQRFLDQTMLELDGTADKSNLGANAILGVSLASARAAAKSFQLPLYRYLNSFSHVLPVPQACLINGGIHAGNHLDIQEYCVMPVGANSFAEAVRMLSEVFLELKALLLEKLGPAAINTSEDGGFAPPLDTSEQALEFLHNAVERAGYAEQMVYGLDMASTGFFNQEQNQYEFEGHVYSRREMIQHWKHLTERFPRIVSLEDPLMEDDLEGFAQISSELSELMIIGDDLFATNVGRIKRGIEAGAANAVLCKLNQIGTLTEAMDAARYARNNGLSVVVSERSGETEDSILADTCVALNAGLLKTGGMRGSDRGSKYNRLMEIEMELGRTARYAGHDFRRPV
jgi:enolase